MSNIVNELPHQTSESTDELLYKQILRLPIELRINIYDIYEKYAYSQILLRKKRALMDNCRSCIKSSVKSPLCLICYMNATSGEDEELIKYIRGTKDTLL
jgi:hypothetical protein